MKTNKEFPNGFTQWMETHHDVVAEITSLIDNKYFDDLGETIVHIRLREHGIGGMYELCEELTDEFEKQFEGVAWGEELEYYDELEHFLTEKLS